MDVESAVEGDERGRNIWVSFFAFSGVPNMRHTALTLPLLRDRLFSRVATFTLHKSPSFKSKSKFHQSKPPN